MVTLASATPATRAGHVISCVTARGRVMIPRGPVSVMTCSGVCIVWKQLKYQNWAKTFVC